MPKRIQRKRTKGWRMPPNAVYVGRPSKWGNRFQVGETLDYGEITITPELAVCLYENHLAQLEKRGILVVKDKIKELQGKDLACWCPLDQPCHADVLLRLANNDNQSRIEFLEEQRMILTIALNRIRSEARLRGLLDNIVITCEEALVEAGDEDYYDG